MDFLTASAADFAAQITATKSQKERVKLCVKLRTELTEKLGTLAAVRRYLTPYRAAIKALPIKQVALLNSLRISTKANNKINSDYKNSVEKHTEQGEFVDISTAAAAEIVAAAKALICDGTRLKVIAGLALLTGRRTAEIVVTARLEKVQRNKLAAKFTGQLKARGERPTYQIPLLADYDFINNALTSVQGLYKDFDISKVNSSLSTNLNKVVKVAFGEWLGEGVKMHDLRKFYAAYAYHSTGGRASKKSFRSFARQILGHGAGDSTTTETYNKYEII